MTDIEQALQEALEEIGRDDVEVTFHEDGSLQWKPADAILDAEVLATIQAAVDALKEGDEVNMRIRNTDPIAAAMNEPTAQELLAQALAQALEAGDSHVENQRYERGHPIDNLDRARAILATEPMQAIARDAAVGRAVLALPRYGGLVHRGDGKWWATTRNHATRDFDTPDAAIAAALGEDATDG